MNMSRAILWSLVFVALAAATATAFPPLFHRRAARLASGSPCSSCDGDRFTYCTCARSLLGGGPGNYIYYAHKHPANCGQYNPCQVTSQDQLATDGICNALCNDDGCNASRKEVQGNDRKPLSPHHAWKGSPKLAEPLDPKADFPLKKMHLENGAVATLPKPISVKFKLGDRVVFARLFALHVVPALLGEPKCAEDVEVILGVGHETTGPDGVIDPVDLTTKPEDVIPTGQKGLVQIYVKPRYYQVAVTVPE